MKKIFPFIRTFLFGLLFGSILFITFEKAHSAERTNVQVIKVKWKDNGRARTYSRHIIVVDHNESVFMQGRNERRYKKALKKEKEREAKK